MNTATEADNQVKLRINELRRRRFLSQTDLAREVTALGLPMRQTTISRMEDGKRKIGVGELVVLAEALGVEPEYLLLGDMPAHSESSRLTGLLRALADELEDEGLVRGKPA